MKIYESLFYYRLKHSSFKVYAFLDSTYYWTDFATIKLSTIADRCNISLNTAQRAVNELIEKGLITKNKRYKNSRRTTNQYKIKRLSGRFISLERNLIYHDMDNTSFVIFCAIAMDKNNNRDCMSFTSLSELTKLTGITRSTIVKKVRLLAENGYLYKQQYISKYGDFGHNNHTVFNLMLRRILSCLLAKVKTVKDKLEILIDGFRCFSIIDFLYSFNLTETIIVLFIYIKTYLFNRLIC